MGAGSPHTAWHAASANTSRAGGPQTITLLKPTVNTPLHVQPHVSSRPPSPPPSRRVSHGVVASTQSPSPPSQPYGKPDLEASCSSLDTSAEGPKLRFPTKHVPKRSLSPNSPPPPPPLPLPLPLQMPSTPRAARGRKLAGDWEEDAPPANGHRTFQEFGAASEPSSRFGSREALICQKAVDQYHKAVLEAVPVAKPPKDSKAPTFPPMEEPLRKEQPIPLEDHATVEQSTLLTRQMDEEPPPPAQSSTVRHHHVDWVPGVGLCPPTPLRAMPLPEFRPLDFPLMGPSNASSQAVHRTASPQHFRQQTCDPSLQQFAPPNGHLLHEHLLSVARPFAAPHGMALQGPASGALCLPFDASPSAFSPMVTHRSGIPEHQHHMMVSPRPLASVLPSPHGRLKLFAPQQPAHSPQNTEFASLSRRVQAVISKCKSQLEPPPVRERDPGFRDGASPRCLPGADNRWLQIHQASHELHAGVKAASSRSTRVSPDINRKDPLSEAYEEASSYIKHDDMSIANSTCTFGRDSHLNIPQTDALSRGSFCSPHSESCSDMLQGVQSTPTSHELSFGSPSCALAASSHPIGSMPPQVEHFEASTPSSSSSESPCTHVSSCSSVKSVPARSESRGKVASGQHPAKGLIPGDSGTSDDHTAITAILAATVDMESTAAILAATFSGGSPAPMDAQPIEDVPSPDHQYQRKIHGPNTHMGEHHRYRNQDAQRICSGSSPVVADRLSAVADRLDCQGSCRKQNDPSTSMVDRIRQRDFERQQGGPSPGVMDRLQQIKRDCEVYSSGQGSACPRLAGRRDQHEGSKKTKDPYMDFATDEDRCDPVLAHSVNQGHEYGRRVSREKGHEDPVLADNLNQGSLRDHLRSRISTARAQLRGLSAPASSRKVPLDRDTLDSTARPDSSIRDGSAAGARQHPSRELGRESLVAYGHNLQGVSEAASLQTRAQTNCEALEREMLRAKVQRSQRLASNCRHQASPSAPQPVTCDSLRGRGEIARTAQTARAGSAPSAHLPRRTTQHFVPQRLSPSSPLLEFQSRQRKSAADAIPGW